MIPSFWRSELVTVVASRIREAARRVLDVTHHAVRRDDPIVHHVRRALSVVPRGGVVHDVLRLECVTAGLTLAWTARRVHPWDRDLPSHRQHQAFAEQCLCDVDCVVTQVLCRFEAVDLLEIAVFHPDSRAKVLGGIISRSDFVAAKRLSIPMRLRMAGITQDSLVQDRQMVS